MNINANSRDTGRWLRDLSSLGWIELDWPGDRWSRAPLVITRLPGSDGLALLVGARSALVDAAVDKLPIEVQRSSQTPSDEGLARPDALLLSYDDPDDLREAADALGGFYVPCAARQLARLLPAPRLGPPAAPPSSSSVVQRYDPYEQRWSPVSPYGDYSLGFYQLDQWGRKRHFYLDAAGWRHCDLPDGCFLELSRAGLSVFGWRREQGPGRDNYGSLFVNWGAPLPPLHRRALVLCSGLTPCLLNNAHTARYDNVPRDVAELVAQSLDQELVRT